MRAVPIFPVHYRKLAARHEHRIGNPLGSDKLSAIRFLFFFMVCPITEINLPNVHIILAKSISFQKKFITVCKAKENLFFFLS